MSKGRRFDRDLRRRLPRLEPRPRVLIVCEGSSTEPAYFHELRRELKSSLIEIEIDGKGGAPKTLVERAVQSKKAAEAAARRQRDDNLRFEEVWCVYDVDEHPRLTDASQQANAHGIHLAISNPCFELWLLLHFQDQTAHIQRDAAQSACRRHLPGYVKHAKYETLSPRYEDAVRRARALETMHSRDGQPGANPSTGVFHLTTKLWQNSRAEHYQRTRTGPLESR